MTLTTLTTADAKQVAGDHYKTDYQHWNMLLSLGYGPEYYVGQATKYLTRWRKKNGLRDLLKGQHFIEKMLEIATERGNGGKDWLPYGHVDDDDLKTIVMDHLNSHLQHFFDVNQVDGVSISICISVMFANDVATLRDAIYACTELAEFEKRQESETKPDLEPPVAQQFKFLNYIEDGIGIRWECRKCKEVLNLRMDEPPAPSHRICFANEHASTRQSVQ